MNGRSLLTAWQGIRNMAAVDTVPSMHETIGRSQPCSRLQQPQTNTSHLKETISSLTPDLSFSMEEVVGDLNRTRVSPASAPAHREDQGRGGDLLE